MKSNEVSFGAWSSPIDSNLVASSNVRYSLPLIRGSDCYWIEGRPWEQGRQVIVCKRDGQSPKDVLPEPFSAVSKVHEYGGGAYTADESHIWFVNQTDQKIYRGSEQEIQPFFGEPDCRYADLEINRAANLLLAVAERHSENQAPRNSLVGICLKTAALVFEVSGADFYSTPRVSPDGIQVTWLQWQHPQMPWDGTQLYLANLTRNGLGNIRRVAGGTGTSIFQPLWSNDGRLYYASDATGWWSIYLYSENREHLVLSKPNAEFGMPQWAFGMAVFGLTSVTSLIAAYSCKGIWHLLNMDLGSGKTETVTQPFSSIHHVCAENGRVLLLGGNTTTPASIIDIQPDRPQVRPITGNPAPSADINDCIGAPESIEFSTGNSGHAYGLLYRPTNPLGVAPTGSLPPLLVKSHSGPTGAADSMLDYRIQYWTSRGYLVLDVNYRGSTGYGRAYRESLHGLWGIADVEDCILAATHLIETQQVDRQKTAISGSSAGGFTVLCALTFHRVFKAGASIYGVGDLEALAKHTHKFESHYLERLVGPYPERADIYRSRSPIKNHKRLESPVILFQGSDDQVVPKDQSQAMYEVLSNKGIPCCYLLFEQEGHGFRKAATLKTVIDGEYAFYTRLFGLKPKQPLLNIPITNFD